MKAGGKKKHPLDEWSDDDDLGSESPGGGIGTFDSGCVIRLTIQNGHCNWRDMKKKEKADPYCVIKYQGEERETITLYGTTHPKWDETFEFVVLNKNNMGKLVIEMWDKIDNKKKEKSIFMGQITLDMSGCSDQSYDYAEPKTHTLKSRSKSQKSDNVNGDLIVKYGAVIKKNRIRSASKAQDSKEEATGLAEELIDDSYESVLRSINMASNARDIHADTLSILDSQGQQLQRIQGKLDGIDTMQNRADRHIRSINSLGGYVANKFIPETNGKNRTKKAEKKVEQIRKHNEKKRKKAAKKTKSFGIADSDSSSDDDIILFGGEPPSQRYATPGVADMYQGDGMVQLSDGYVDKMRATDQALDVLGDLIHDLHGMSVQAGEALDEHNARLEIIDRSVQRANYRLQGHNARIRK